MFRKISNVYYIVYNRKKLNKNKCGIKNGILIYSFVLPIATFGIYSTLLYSGLRIKLSELSETFLIISCILLLFANAIIFLMYDYIFQLNYEKQMFEMISLKTDMEKNITIEWKRLM